MNGKPSRITVLNILHNLEQKKTIDAVKRSNGQLYQLFINKDDLIASLQTNLGDFENTYFLLLQKAKDRFEEKTTTTRKTIGAKTTTRVDVDNEFISTLSCMLWIYEDMVKAYLIYAFLIWPDKTNNNSEKLNELYTILFSRLTKMQLKLSNALPIKSLVLLATKTMIVRSLELPRHIEATLDHCKEYDLFDEAAKTIDAVWNIAFDLFHEGYHDAFNQYHLHKVKDWKELLKLRKQHPDLRDTMDDMRNSFLIQLDKSHIETKNDNHMDG
jgi:hypothetical protein